MKRILSVLLVNLLFVLLAPFSAAEETTIIVELNSYDDYICGCELPISGGRGVTLDFVSNPIEMDDPLPEGAVLNQLQIIAHGILCNYTLDTLALEGTSIGAVTSPVAGCSCNDCLASNTLSSVVYPNGFPGYIYGGKNTLSSTENHNLFISYFEIKFIYDNGITVNTFDDELNNDGDCSLREAIEAANSDTAVDGCPAGNGSDKINLPAGTYDFSIPGTAEDLNQTGDLDISSDILIIGAGKDLTFIDGGDLDRIFHITGSHTVTLNHFTIQNGYVEDANGYGGGIYNEGTLTIKNSDVTSCYAQGDDGNGAGGGFGGAVYNENSLSLEYSELYGNTAQGGKGANGVSRAGGGGGGAGLGGGIYNADSALLLVDTCVFQMNAASGGDKGYQSGYDWSGDGTGGAGGGAGGAGGTGTGAGLAGSYGGGGGGGGSSYDGGGLGGNGGFGGGGGGGGANASGGNGGVSGTGGYGAGSGGLAQGAAGADGGSGAGLGAALFDNGGDVTIADSTFIDNVSSGGDTDAYGYGAGLFSNAGTIGFMDSIVMHNIGSTQSRADCDVYGGGAITGIGSGTLTVGGVCQTCGNGVLEGEEECDDDNNDNGDGCSATCAVEAGFSCDTASPSVCTDYDECEGENGGDNCNTNASCTNTPGSFICSCNAGYYGDGVTCNGCPAGKYSTAVGAITVDTCAPCEAGNYANGTANTSCTVCDEGTYAAGTGNASCTLCTAGTYASGKGNISCTACSAGYYQDAAGQTSCDACAAGYYQNNTGQIECLACVGGAYQNQTGQASCVECPVGTYSFGSANTSCTPCDVGYFQSMTGKTSCSACPAGEYQNLTGQSVCIDCAAGSFTDDTGNALCEACPTGTYQNHTGMPYCESCLAGTYANNTGSTSCNVCAAGTFASGTGNTSCSTCATGTYASGTGNATCTSCAAGYYTDTTGSTSCNACAAGSYATGTGNTTCSACAAGTYVENAASAVCANCAAGYFANTTGNISCTACAVGSYAAGTANTECTLCGIGDYQNLTGQATCLDCAEGFTNNSTGSIACDLCTDGYYGENCTACPVCVHGACNDGDSGNGACVCDTGWSGDLCDVPPAMVINEMYFYTPQRGVARQPYTEIKGPAGASLDGCYLIGLSQPEGITLVEIDLSGNVIPEDGYFLISYYHDMLNSDFYTTDIDWLDDTQAVLLSCDDIDIDLIGYGMGAVIAEGDPVEEFDVNYPLIRSPNGIDTDDNAADFVNAREFTPGYENPDMLVDWCRLQWPDSISGAEYSESPDVYGRVYIEGLTDQSQYNDWTDFVTAQVGYGPAGTVPDNNWTWTDAIPNDGYDGGTSGESANDEYVGWFNLPAYGSSNQYAYRFSADAGHNWLVCDFGAEGSANGYNSANAGVLNISDDLCRPDPCNDHGSCSEGICTCDDYWTGDACDLADQDNDGVPDTDDNCIDEPNTEQVNSDTDTLGDVCDNCIDDDNEEQTDFDVDGFGDVCDPCPDDRIDDPDDDGYCAGERFNMPMAGGGDCDEDPDSCGADCSPGLAETCDGQDNDCNGSSDEIFAGLGDPCQVGTGVCLKNGNMICSPDHQSTVCNIAAGTPESDTDTSCDTKDNDCDGSTDEDYPEDVTDCGTGACASTGHMYCDNGSEKDSCVAPEPLVLVDESCNDVDNDCDGSTDEDYPTNATECGTGVCLGVGNMYCDNGVEKNSCEASQPLVQVDESCNKVDNDCDGETDEDYPEVSTECGVGACATTGNMYCEDGSEKDSCEALEPEVDVDETCNTVDNDCDGETDEDYPGDATECGLGECVATGNKYCENGEEKDTCVPGEVAEELCDGFDSNCNGVDDAGEDQEVLCGANAQCDTAAQTIACVCVDGAELVGNECIIPDPCAGLADWDDCEFEGGEDGVCFDEICQSIIPGDRCEDLEALTIGSASTLDMLPLHNYREITAECTGADSLSAPDWFASVQLVDSDKSYKVTITPEADELIAVMLTDDCLTDNCLEPLFQAENAGDELVIENLPSDLAGNLVIQVLLLEGVGETAMVSITVEEMEEVDGDVIDGDETDGDETDGDELDGDEVDGDEVVDGDDVADGDDVVDGDENAGGDGNIDGDEADGDNGAPDSEYNVDNGGCNSSSGNFGFLILMALGLLITMRKIREI